jgi:hypothetical protein
VDATRVGNLGHLLNHSCDPNCDSRTLSLGELPPACMALRAPVLGLHGACTGPAWGLHGTCMGPAHRLPPPTLPPPNPFHPHLQRPPALPPAVPGR